MSLAERIALVNKKIAAAARQAGREPSEVTLVAATKVQTSDTCLLYTSPSPRDS